MKKIFDAFKAWIRGEEIEAEIAVPASVLFLIIAVVVFFIVKLFL